MKAFVTGATGFVGSHLVDLLLKEGFEVFCLKRSTSSTKWLDGKNVSFVNGDLFSNEVLENVIKDMDYVFHVAGIVKAKTKEDFEKGNAIAARNLIEITAKINPGIKKFILVSSGAVCGPNPDSEPLSEDYIPRPITTYGITKRQAEIEVLKFKDTIPVVIVRPPAVYGPRDTEVFIYFKTFYSGLNTIIGLSEKYVSLIHVIDLVNGIYLAGVKPTNSGDIFFISSNKDYNWVEVGKVASLAMGKKALKLRIPHFIVYTVGAIAQLFSVFSKNAPTLNLEKCKDITRKRWVFSNSKAVKQLGFNESYTLEEGFRNTFEWYKNQGWL